MWDGLMTAIGNNIDNTKTNWANFIMNERTNSSNRSIADSTNDANYRLWQEQLAYQKERYEQEKAENQRLVKQAHNWDEQSILRQHHWDLEKRSYDDYQSQVQRMRKAGLNPYLMTGQTSSVSGAGATSAGGTAPTGQNPSFPTASPIPFDKGFPMQTARWQSLSQTGTGWFDMAAKKQELDNDTMRALAEVHEKGVNSKVLQQTFDNLAQEFKFNHDSWDKRMEALELANESISHKMALDTAEFELRKSLADSQIKLNDATIQHLAALFLKAMSEVGVEKYKADIMAGEAATYAKHVGNEVIHLANQDAAIFEQLGMDKELLGSRKWHNIISSVTDGITSAVFSFFALKGFKGVKAIKGFRK